MKQESRKKLFVIDTSVVLYDHNAIQNFQEHDVVIPIQVLEELDNFKKGNETRNFEARNFIRFIDGLSHEKLLNDWIPLNGSTKGSLKVVSDFILDGPNAEHLFGGGKYDHKILNTALHLQEKHPEKNVILVSKDTCLRLKAKSMNIHAEDYETGKVKDVQHLYTGYLELEDVAFEILDLLKKGKVVPLQNFVKTDLVANEYLILRNGKRSVLAYFDPIHRQIEKVGQQEFFGVKARNAEQCFAIHALLNPNLRLVTLQGVAGTGKTLLAVASALAQRRDFHQIYVARPIVPLGNRDLGYLPGDISSKLDPYMQPIWDNLKFIKSQLDHDPKMRHKIDDMVSNEKIAVVPLAYMRGRSLANVFFIVDEAQNLTPHEVKTIISRAGDQTKVVFIGDIHQIDTPYLDSQSNGLSYLIDNLKSHQIFGHITLEKGERSELANLANQFL